MELCPKCKTAVRIDGGGYENGFQIMQFYCINPRCPNGKLNGDKLLMPFQIERVKLPENSVKKDIILCCDKTMAFVTDEGYYIIPDMEKNTIEENGKLAITCPECGKVTEISVEEKTQIR